MYIREEFIHPKQCTMPDLNDYIRELELAGSAVAFPEVSQRSIFLESTENSSEAFLSNKSVISFVSDVSGQNRDDVLSSTLLAQLAADAAFPEPENVLQWYGRYEDVLTNIGWVMQNKVESSFKSNKSLFEIQEAILEVLGSAVVGGPQAAIIQSTLNALKSMADKEGMIEIFRRNVTNNNNSHFQVSAVDETNGAVAMGLGGFMLNTTERITRLFGIGFSMDKTELRYRTARCTLNTAMFKTIRDSINEKLGEATQKFIARLPDISR